MDLAFTTEEEVFRDEVRAFLADSLPSWLSAKVKGQKRLSKSDYETWHNALAARGWLAWQCPQAYSGAE